MTKKKPTLLFFCARLPRNTDNSPQYCSSLMSWFTLQQPGNFEGILPFSYSLGRYKSLVWEANLTDDECSLLPLTLILLLLCFSHLLNRRWWMCDGGRGGRDLRGLREGDKQKTKSVHARDKKRQPWLVCESDILNHSYADRMTHKREPNTDL